MSKEEMPSLKDLAKTVSLVKVPIPTAGQATNGLGVRLYLSSQGHITGQAGTLAIDSSQ